MSELMKKPRTDGYVDFTCRVPASMAPAVQKAFEGVLALVREQERTYTVEEVFPGYAPGHALRGARQMHDLTQRELAERIGVAATHISEMERGKRPIGKSMAKRLAAALQTDYKVFL